MERNEKKNAAETLYAPAYTRLEVLISKRKTFKALLYLPDETFHSFRFQKDVKLECDLFKADEISSGKLLQKSTIRRNPKRSFGHVVLMQLQLLTRFVYTRFACCPNLFSI